MSRKRRKPAPSRALSTVTPIAPPVYLWNYPEEILDSFCSDEEWEEEEQAWMLSQQGCLCQECQEALKLQAQQSPPPTQVLKRKSKKKQSNAKELKKRRQKLAAVNAAQASSEMASSGADPGLLVAAWHACRGLYRLFCICVADARKQGRSPATRDASGATQHAHK